MASGIKDKVAILGMGCSKFGERWDAGAEDLMVEAFNEAMTDAGIQPSQLGAAFFSTHMDDVGVGRGGTPLSIALRLAEHRRHPRRELLRRRDRGGARRGLRRRRRRLRHRPRHRRREAEGHRLRRLAHRTVGTYIPQWYPNAVAPANFAQLASAIAASTRWTRRRSSAPSPTSR